MSDKKISQLTAATTPLAGTEMLPIVQSGATVKATVASITDRLGLGTMATQAASNVAITGGTINGTTIGATTKATGAFTTVESNIAVTYGVASNNAINIETTVSGSTLTATGYGALRWTSGAYSPASIEAVRVSPGGGFGTDLIFRTHPNSGFAATDKVRITSGGNIKFENAGNGIDFSATAGTGTSELLADYEEGTWTPAWGGTGGAPTCTYSTQSGTYTKIGNKIICWFEIATATASGGAGTLQITGLPFSISNGSLKANYAVTFTTNMPEGCIANGTAANLTARYSDIEVSYLGVSALSATSYIIGMIVATA